MFQNYIFVLCIIFKIDYMLSPSRQISRQRIKSGTNFSFKILSSSFVTMLYDIMKEFNKTKMKYAKLQVCTILGILMETQARGGIKRMYVFRHNYTASLYLGLASCLKDMIIKLTRPALTTTTNS